MAFHVHTNDRVPFVFRHSGEHPVAQETSVQHERVQPPEFVDRLTDHRLGLVPVGDIGAVGDCYTATGTDLGHDFLRCGRCSAGSIPFDT